MQRYSNSRIQQFKACPLSSFYRDELGLQKIDEEKTEHHLVYGKAFHSALKHLYMGDSLESAKSIFKKEYPTQLDPDDLAKTQANGLLVLDSYAKTYAEEDKKWRILSCEEKESFDYGSDENFTVVLDLVWENITHGGIYGVDHKIVGGKKATLGFDFWNSFEPNSQVTKYYSYVKKKYGDCSGFYINAIGMGHRKRAYKGEPAGPWHRMQRQMFNRSAAQLEREEVDTEYWIERIEHARGTGYWGMNTDGCRWCTYRPICAAGWSWQEDRELIEIQYQVKTPTNTKPISASGGKENGQ